MNWTDISTIYYKEMLETLRDRRTLVLMVLVPLALYPLLAVGVSQLHISQREKISQRVSKIAIIQEDQSNDLKELFKQEDKIEIVDLSDPQSALKAGEIQGIVKALSDFHEVISLPKTVKVEIIYDQAEDASQKTVEKLETIFNKYSKEILQKRLKEKNLPQEFAEPIKVEFKNIASSKKMGGYLIGQILPMLCISVMILGVFYPAIDLTAGEKERGTLQTLLITPVKSIDIVVGKFLAISTIAFGAAILNLGSMAFTFSLQLFGSSELFQKIDFSISPIAIFSMLLVLFPTALFFSAIMMSVAIFAKSFKEAQNLLTPVYLIFVILAIVTPLPGVELKGIFVILPVSNLTLLMKELLLGKATVDQILLVLFVMSAYAVLAITFAARVFRREEVLFAQEFDLKALWRRREIVPKSLPSMGEGAVLYMLLLILTIYLGSIFQMHDLWTGLIITEWLLILFPTIIFIKCFKLNFTSTLTLYKTKFSYFIATILLSLSSWYLITHTIVKIQNIFLPMPQSFKETMERLFVLPDGNGSIFMYFFTFALSPAICEEVLFRGVLLSAFRKELPRWASLILIGLLFGIMHLSIYRILSTGILGILITYVAWQSGSIYPAILFHTINNSIALLVMNLDSSSPLSVLAKEEGSTALFAIALSMSLLGIWLCRKKSKPNL